MDLKELLGEELYGQVVEKAGDNKLAVISDGNWFPKDKFDSVNEDNKELKGQIKDRDGQLAKLKEVDPKALQDEIERLEGENETTKNEYEQKLQDKTFDYALKDALTGAKVRNPKAVKALLDTEQIKLDGDKLLNLDSQLEALKESDAYLFEAEVEETPPNSPAIVTPGNPNGGSGGGESDPFAAKLAKYD